MCCKITLISIIYFKGLRKNTDFYRIFIYKMRSTLGNTNDEISLTSLQCLKFKTKRTLKLMYLQTSNPFSSDIAPWQILDNHKFWITNTDIYTVIKKTTKQCLMVFTTLSPGISGCPNYLQRMFCMVVKIIFKFCNVNRCVLFFFFFLIFFFNIFIANKSHSYKTSWLGTWHQRY